MAASRIKGIIVEIGGDTTKLQTALKGVNTEIKNTQAQLKDVEKLLKLDPGNTELLAQKEKLLAQAVEETKKKLESLKTAAEQANTALENGDISQKQFDALQREILETEQDLKKLEAAANQSSTALQKIGATGEKLKTVGDGMQEAGKKMLPATAAVTALGTASVSTAENFESAMSQVQATMGITKDSMSTVDGQSVNTMTALNNLAKEMGKSTAFSATECAQALNYLALAGYDTEQMTKTLPTVLNLAVSTDSDEQAGSYEVQVEHYTDYISRNKEWELAGIYADDGISGTNTKKREGFNEMIDDCMEGKIDLVITKSISRFARNTLDCLKYVRQLRDKNIAIIFEKENINTLEASGELLLTIMASLAQQESQSLSQNVKLGLQFRYQNGQVQVNHNHFLGYTKDADGNLVIDEEEAKIVRRIYREYLEGASLRNIAQSLERDKIMTGGKGYRWHQSTIKGILKNEKYIGDALLQKTITTDFIEKTRIKNDGSYPQYYVTGNHEAIIL